MMSQTPHGRVLLVEDEPEQASVLKRWIEVDLGLTVDIASDGPSAEGLLVQPKYTLIITDVGLPGYDGLQLLQLSKEIFPERPGLVITAFEGRAVLLEALRKHADDFLAKPLTRDYSVQVIERLTRDTERHSSITPQRQNIVAISAHPDDAEIGCGGALLKHRAAGDCITVVVLSDGSRGGSSDQRADEARQAAENLGAKLELIGLPDGAVSDGPDTILPLEKIIQREQPDIVYTHTPRDSHQDHRAVAHASQVAARGVRSIFCYQSPSSTVHFQPTRFVGIRDVLDAKIKLLESFGSQTEVRPYLDVSAIQSTAIYWGRFAGAEPAEPLEVIRDHA
ncbi:MAG: PIG-L family deacetylase [Polyangiaceae bacterium]|nr:PIG-L family deacetylase [Polyangiaceae bacterium]